MIEKKNNSFKFYSNFLEAINVLPEDERANACYEFCKYGITGELPEDKTIAMFCIGVSVSVQKYQGRGGNHNPSGKNQWSKVVKSGQNGQNGLNEQTETKTKTKTEIGGEKESKVNKKEFTPPTLKEVIDYSRLKGREDLAESFYQYYDPTWKDKDNNPIKNWKNKFNTWIMRNPLKEETRDVRGYSIEELRKKAD